MAKLFHTPRPNEFEVKPRYWDKEKEERDAHFHRAHVGEKLDGTEHQTSISKGSFRSNPIEAKWNVSKVKRTSNYRLLILIVLLGVALFFILT